MVLKILSIENGTRPISFRKAPEVFGGGTEILEHGRTIGTIVLKRRDKFSDNWWTVTIEGDVKGHYPSMQEARKTVLVWYGSVAEY